MQDRMNSTLDGKQIDLISFPNGDCCRAINGSTLVYHYEYHGEYADAWVISIVEGKEIVRYNAKFIESIVWL